ncbi:LOB domain-containing protein 22 [Ziziphus jujuba]|uniref:LOB domain-containing protein 22 n=2 Tax=Ziziphus jujuba TaxID=326968 RepID=A0A6P4A577_ZIZJJ|nr:LOB domain-containing protein 22 [Ziziphus jujuba]KAH7519211.1 hypothetical protein FEM48_Zijuj08G0011600 [Ziziphus jujuba var. spinosa]
MSKESGVYQACASCKHQRKKCDDNCELAPYFPASRFREFQNAYRLFGVSNIQKIMASVEPHQRQAAAESILMEGNYRRNDPVNGCLGVCRNLNSHIISYEKQLKIVNQQLAMFRQREKFDRHQNHLSNSYISSMPSISSEKSSSLNLHRDHQFDALKFPPPLLSDMARDDYMGDAKNLQQAGYIYRSTLEEGADLKPFDIQLMDQIMESDEHGSVLETEELSAGLKAHGKQLLQGMRTEDEMKYA